MISAPLFAQTDAAKSTTSFLVVRHAERDGNLDKLTAAGEERSQMLAALGKALKVGAIYSTDTKRTKGTVQPLATAADVEIQTYGRPTGEWVAELKQKHAGQVVLIVGHSNTTGVIAGMLAKKTPFKIAHDEYDALFLVQDSGSEPHCLRLQYGNSSTGAESADPDKMGVIDPPRKGK